MYLAPAMYLALFTLWGTEISNTDNPVLTVVGNTDISTEYKYGGYDRKVESISGYNGAVGLICSLRPVLYVYIPAQGLSLNIYYTPGA